ncbi:TIGR03905 family TSCPD domain-containing protein [Selenomonas ruminantium]|uniref:ribonucleoside-diphosphate reductase n=1 Tax=Selenomonas ruminantium TaxID=971 RepID=A0A1H0RAJ0_SELRU|nr:TIGR03905 family TSCPD domain-containing protein [Selenomonas ruminantium]SDP26410.1 uncharacterized protein TIGR03905 [Selenomonas ruminantium]
MSIYEYKTQGTCSRKITVELDGKIIKSVKFEGGCAGNLSGIAKLVVGMDIDHVIERFAGNTCGPRPTSCPDQLAIALREAYEAQQAG